MGDIDFAELISKIAHELRSPLTSVKGFSATLVNRWDAFADEQKRQFVETIHADAERMGRIITEVLDLARLETGRLELSRTMANVSAAADAAVNNLSHLEAAERVTNAIPEELTAWADVARLEHILTNLLENACKFSDEGSIDISADVSDDGWVEVAVADQGVGIEDERIAELFSGPGPTGQVSGPTGTGLGLYLTRRLVEAHGGTISVASEDGRGSTFTLRLPAEGSP